MMSDDFARFIAETREVPFSQIGDDIRLGGAVLSEAERAALIGEFEAWTPPPDAREVDAERDRRIADGFSFNGAAIQLDPGSQSQVIAMSAAARFAIAGGAQENDLRWADPDHDFGWICTDNTIMSMDAPTMAAMGDAAMLWVSRHIFAARAIKDAIGAGNPPADVTDDGLWPSPPQ